MLRLVTLFLHFSTGFRNRPTRRPKSLAQRAIAHAARLSVPGLTRLRWGVIEAMPFTDIMENDIEKDVRTITRSQVVRFYLWSLRQTSTFRNLGCAAMFTYLTGFRAAEVRPFHIDGKTKEGVLVTSAKRKKGQAEVLKLREWSTRLRVVVARAEQTHSVPRQFLFANSKG